jgi:lipopolysaccharide heptosyltransferase II
MDLEAEPRPLAASLLQPRRILVRGVNWLGDAVMTMPALQRLRERFPQAHIALLAPEKLRALWQHHPAVNQIMSTGPKSGVIHVARMLARERLDLALVLPNSPRSALESWLARVPQRIGYARPWRSWMLTRAIPARPGHVPMRKRSPAEIHRLIRSADDPTRNPKPEAGSRKPETRSVPGHHLFNYLHLVSVATGADPEPLPPRLFVSPDEIEAACRKFDLNGVTGPVFGMNPGAEYGPAKRWPTERFIAAAREIQNRTNCVWLVFGGTNDVGVGDAIRSALRPSPRALRNLVGQTSLAELCALLKRCRVLLTNDSGTMHVASALGTPVVVPFGSTSPELTGPGLPGEQRHRILKSAAPCSPCFLRRCPIDFRCMNGIGVEQIVEAVLQICAK